MQPNLYDFLQIRIRLDEIKSYFGFGGDTRLKTETGISGNVSEYLEPLECPPRKVKTLAEKLHQKLGINPDWVLFGRGPMLVKDIVGRDEEALKYERVGRMLDALLRELYGESCPICGKGMKKPDGEPGL